MTSNEEPVISPVEIPQQGNPATKQEITTHSNIDDRSRDARLRGVGYHARQRTRKIGAAVIGTVLAVGATVGPHLGSSTAFPEYIANGTCGPEGGSRIEKLTPYEQSQNKLKNRFILPDRAGDINAEIKIDDLLNAKPPETVRVTSAAKITG
jgi:hypothetical protein